MTTTSISIKHSMYAQTWLEYYSVREDWDGATVRPSSRNLSKSGATGWYHYDNLPDGIYESHQDRGGDTIRYWSVEDTEGREITKAEADAIIDHDID